MIDARWLGALVTCLLLGTAAAALLGGVAAVPFQLAYGVAAAGLGAVFYLAPPVIHRQLRRLARPAEPRDSLGALGSAAALVFSGLGAFVLVASALNEAFVSDVWPLLFPALPLFAALVGLGREGYRALLRWLDAEARDDF